MRSFVSAACIATEQIGHGLGGIAILDFSSIRPINVPILRLGFDPGQKGPLLNSKGTTMDGKGPVPPSGAVLIRTLGLGI
jgi:hypothetical protein